MYDGPGPVFGISTMDPYQITGSKMSSRALVTLVRIYYKAYKNLGESNRPIGIKY